MFSCKERAIVSKGLQENNTVNGLESIKISSYCGKQIRSDTLSSLILNYYESNTTYTSTYKPLGVKCVSIFNVKTEELDVFINDFDIEVEKEKYNCSNEHGIVDSTLHVKVLELQSRINSFFNQIDLNSLEIKQKVLSHLLGYRLNHFQEFQLDRYDRLLGNTNNRDTECCKRSVTRNLGKIIHGIYRNNRDVYQTQMRGVFVVNYLNDTLELDYKLHECNLPLRLQYLPYDQTLQSDALSLMSKFKIDE